MLELNINMFENEDKKSLKHYVLSKTIVLV